MRTKTLKNIEKQRIKGEFSRITTMIMIIETEGTTWAHNLSSSQKTPVFETSVTKR